MVGRLYILSFCNDPFSGGTSHFRCWKKTPSFTPSPLSTLTLLHLHLRHASGRQGYTVGSHRTCHAIGWPRLCLQRCRHRSRTGPRLHGIGAIGIHLSAVVGETELLGMWFFPVARGERETFTCCFGVGIFIYNPNDNSKYGKHLENMWNIWGIHHLLEKNMKSLGWSVRI